jgi:hypothetical protein
MKHLFGVSHWTELSFGEAKPKPQQPSDERMNCVQAG